MEEIKNVDVENSIENNEENSVDISLDITNEDILYSMDILKKNSTKENFKALMDKLDHARILVPLVVDTTSGKKMVMPMPLMTGDGKIFQPIYTDKDRMAQGLQGAAIANMDFNEIMDLVVRQSGAAAREDAKVEKLVGILINPRTDNILLPVDELCEIAFSK